MAMTSTSHMDYLTHNLFNLLKIFMMMLITFFPWSMAESYRTTLYQFNLQLDLMRLTLHMIVKDIVNSYILMNWAPIPLEIAITTTPISRTPRTLTSRTLYLQEYPADFYQNLAFNKFLKKTFENHVKSPRFTT